MSMIALGGIIGAGLFVGSGSAIATAGPAAVLAYAAGGILVVLVMRMLGEMATTAPALGSFAAYARNTLGDWAGFVVGWTYWYFWVVTVAFEAVAGAAIVHGWLGGVPLWVVALCLMTVMTVINLLSVRTFGEAEFWFASVKVIAVVVFLAAGIAAAAGWRTTGALPGAPFGGTGGFAPHGVRGVISALVVVVFAYFGSEMITLAAAESDEPERAIARATVSVVWRVIVFYVGSVAVIVCVVPWDEVPIDSSPFVAVLDRLGINGVGTVMNAIVLTAVLSLLNSGIYASSRMLFALARAGDASPRFCRTGSRGVPSSAIALATVAGWVSVFFAYVSPDAVFGFLLNSTGAVALFLYLAIAASHLRMRRQAERDGTDGQAVQMWFFPYLTYLTVAAVVAIIVAMAVFPSSRAELLTSVLAPCLIGLAWSARRMKAGRRAGAGL